MARDGTRRGGARPGAGRPRKSLDEKLRDGDKADVMMVPEELEGADIPPVREFITQEQKDGTKLCSEEVYNETYEWLKKWKCDAIVSRQLVEQYAMTIGRWIHCEKIISSRGYLSKHPTTGQAIASPYVKMSQDYMKQANTLWNEIFQIVRENSTGDFETSSPQASVMEMILTARTGG